MPDVESRLTELRDELHAAVPVPDLATVTDRFRQRRTRRRMQLGAVAAVLAVSAVVPALRQLDVRQPAAPPPTTSQTTSQTSPTPGVTVLFDVQFAEDGSGYTVRGRCEEGTGEVLTRPCALTLLTTDDLETWVEVGPVPTPDRDDLHPVGQLSVLGPNELVFDWAATGDGAGSESARMHSADGGRSWQDVPMPAVVTDTVAAIPDHAALQPACLAALQSQACGTPTFTVVWPGPGAPAVLADPPPLSNPRPGALPTADGQWWVLGNVPGTARWALAVSTDDGRTWTTTPLDDGLPTDLSMSVVSQGGTLYATASGTEPGDSAGLRAIFRSDDDGRTWERTWRPVEGQLAPGHMAGLVAAADGTLHVYEYDRAFTSSDGGRTLEVTAEGRDGFVRWTRAGYVAVGTDSFELSPDGVHWREYDLPPP